ncbi:MAG: lytic transglycosylase domain-containing protein [Synergistaceae bacterium]|nr:lytic transglycosylase domain-containing protein [Synergistaceae bacterium]
MIGPDLTSVNRVLGRITEIQRQSMPDFIAPNIASVNKAGDANKSRFVDVLKDVQDKNKFKEARNITGKTSYEEMQDVINECADKYNIDNELIRAIIQVESGWNTGAVSNKGAQGLMQLMPKTAEMLGVNNPFDPAQNIEGGARYISDLTDKYRGDVEKALAAYNAGPARVDSGNIPAVSSRYVKNVMAIYHKLRERG